ncbi:transposase family protein [Streptomyces sp. NBC_01298]|uniref:transposase family protein n=1 Tax=Streptomyces sp. NBC_01298 TaxID=2903817 RepID=UPI003FA370FC
MNGVQVADLLLPGVAVEVDQLVLTDAEVRVAVRSGSVAAACPGCRRRSSRVHCYYQRTLADRPVAGRRVRIELRARRLVCGNGQCDRRTFAEQIPGLTHRHARRTDAPTAQLTDVALFLGGRPGAREIQRLGYRGDVNTVRQHLKPYRNGAIPVSAPLPHLTVRGAPTGSCADPSASPMLSKRNSPSCASGTPRWPRPSSAHAAWHS